MKIANRRNPHIKELAEFLALEHNSDIETQLEAIAELEGISVFYDDYENAFDGTLVYDDGYYIHINTNLGNKPKTQRGRFTLAHELGHYFIDSHRIALKKGLLEPHPSRYNKNTHQKIEREADYFASCILMPEKRFRQDCKRFRKFDFSVIKFLSKKYNVSITACALRFADVGTHSIMVVYMENNRIEWRWNSDDFKYWKLADGKEIVPEDSLAGKYFKTGIGYKRTEELWALDWFEVSDRDLNCKVHEQVIPYKNKVLSIIWGV